MDLQRDPTFTFQGKRYYITCKRWGVLFLTCFILSLDGFSYFFFSYINDMTSKYFNIVPAMTDLMATLNGIGRTVGSIVICVFSDWMRLRNIAVYGSAANSLAVIVVAVGVYVREYRLVLSGMFVNGAISGLLMNMVQVIAMTWFPLHERGKATALPWVIRRLSIILSNIIATRSIGVYTGDRHSPQIMQTDNVTEHLMVKFHIVFTSTFGVISFLILISCIISAIYVVDNPPVFENDKWLQAQTNERTPILHNHKSKSQSFSQQLKDMIYISTNSSLVLIFFVFAFATLDNPLGSFLITSLVIAGFPQTNDQVVGAVFSIGILIGSVGSIVAGQVLDKFSQPRLTSIVYATVCIIGLVAFSLSFHFHTLTGVFAFYFVLWSTRDGLCVCMFHRLAAMTINDSHSIRVMTFSVAVTASSLAIAVSGVIIRFLFDRYSPAVGVLYPLPFLILSLLTYIFLWKHYQGPSTTQSKS